MTSLSVGRNGALTIEDFRGTTVSAGPTPVVSVPSTRCPVSKGQAAIIGVGALEYPAEFRGPSEKLITQQGLSKIITLTSTARPPRHSGAGSGEFLKLVEHYLLGGDDFTTQSSAT